MRGLSWGGINTLQIAARNPPALKAIMPMGCCDNRFTDDAHYLGGALGHTNFQWGVLFKAVMAGPPDPAVVGPDWQAQWEKRLAATPPILSQWLSHQRYDAYWRRGSVALDYGAIKIPTYLVSGWQDTYAHPVGRLLERLTCPMRAMIGPWGHTYPWAASPQGLDWASEEVRWWRHWLCGEATGVMDGPVASLFMPYKAAAEVLPQATPGRWIAVAKWPARTTRSAMFLTPEGLAAKPAAARTVTLSSEPVIGLTKPEWLDRPPIDQSTDDARSLAYDSAPLEAPLEILGTPTLAVTLASDAPVAQLAVRLTEVAPDGRSWLVTWGLLNLTHRDSHFEPAQLKPGQRQDVTVELKLIAHRRAAASALPSARASGPWPGRPRASPS
jgi:putative CocE/NonD family hydrolase